MEPRSPEMSRMRNSRLRTAIEFLAYEGPVQSKILEPRISRVPFQAFAHGHDLAEHRTPNWYEVIHGRSYRSRLNRFGFLGRSGSRWLCNFAVSYRRKRGNRKHSSKSPDIRIYFTPKNPPRNIGSLRRRLINGDSFCIFLPAIVPRGIKLTRQPCDRFISIF